MREFYERVREQQIAWRRRALRNQERGWWNRVQYDHILPRTQWHLNLWPGIADTLPTYIDQNGIQPHTGKHNLCSSWVLCANLYFPFKEAGGRRLLASFLREQLSLEVSSVEAIELEYERPERELKPSELLGEDQGARGSGQTSPDLAFELTTPVGQGLMLVESKYTEHWFYQCSGYRKKAEGRDPNPNRSRCEDFDAVVRSPATQCHLVEPWKRQYWDHLKFNVAQSARLLGCPAARGAYQIFRQQALAEALAKTERWTLVVSAVAFDAGNTDLFRVLRTRDGTADLRVLWPELLQLRAPFLTFTHQTWVAWVRAHGGDVWKDWLTYVQDRYGY